MTFEISRRKLRKLMFLLFFLSFDAVSSSAGKDETELGREIVARYLGAAPLIKDQSSLNYINSLGQYLTRSLPPEERERKWFFGVLETDSVNAFAAPGGYVLITKGFWTSWSQRIKLLSCWHTRYLMLLKNTTSRSLMIRDACTN